MIDIRPNHMEMVRKILAEHVPGFEVRAFGSRVGQKAKKHSDLDLVIMADGPIPNGTLAHLRDAFSESDLPFKVDAVIWSSISENFRKIIEKKYEIVQAGGSL